MLDLIKPNWPAPPQVRAVTTTKHGGVSRGNYASFNLASHVGDDLSAVAHNRQILRTILELPAEPHWLEQVHGTNVIKTDLNYQLNCKADASCADSAGLVCAVLTADCLPVLFCDTDGTRVAAAHAGWRGLLAGILEKTITQLNVAPHNLMAWLGPAIGPQAFEVGNEVRKAFIEVDDAASSAFFQSLNGRWLADIYQLARLRLNKMGVQAIYGGNFCTFSDTQLFYSYRRTKLCGRIASLIWII